MPKAKSRLRWSIANRSILDVSVTGRALPRLATAALMAVGFTGGCAIVDGSRSADIPYAGEIRPTQSRPAFAVPQPAAPTVAASELADGRQPFDVEPTADAEPAATRQSRLAQGPAVATAPIAPVTTERLTAPLRSAEQADASIASEPHGESAMPAEPIELSRPLASPRSSSADARHRLSEPIASRAEQSQEVDASRGPNKLTGPAAVRSAPSLSLGNGARHLTAADWAALADLARRQRESGGRLRVEVYRAGRDITPEAADHIVAVTTALLRLGVRADRIDVQAVEPPADAGDASVRADAATVNAARVFLDSGERAG